MALVNQPAILPGAFAAEGDKNTIPANNDGLSGLASIAKGFPQITQVPLAQGGQPPQRQDFNGIFNLFSQFLLFAQNGGVYAYNNTLDYQPPCIISYDGEFYSCVAENGPSTSAGVQPVTNTTYWEKLVPDVAVMTGATASVAGKSGLVPTPAAGENDEFLRGDGTWQPINTMKGASASAAGAAGLVPAPTAGATNRYLRSDGSWQVPPDTKYSNMKGATSSAAGRSGLVPAPAAGNQNKALFGDATYKQVVQKVNGVAADGAGNVTIDIPEPVIASESEAKAGTNNTKYMTPLRVKQAIDALADSGWTVSKGTNGWARDNTTGFTIQWGQVSGVSSSASPQTITFPRTFTTLYTVINIPNHEGVDIDGYYFYVTSQSTSKFVVRYTEDRRWVAFGVS